MVIIVDGSRMDLADQFLGGMIDRAGKVGYEVKIEQIEDSVPFLNVVVGIDHERRRYTTRLYTKPSDVHNVPLDPRSAQPWHTHGVWPRAQLKVAARIEGSAITSAQRLQKRSRLQAKPYGSHSPTIL